MEYEWIELRQDLEVLVRISYANTLDGMPKPFGKVLAFLEGELKSEPVPHWEWSANLHDQKNNHRIPASTDLFQARINVEKYFQQQLEEDSTSPPGEV